MRRQRQKSHNNHPALESLKDRPANGWGGQIHHIAGSDSAFGTGRVHKIEVAAHDKHMGPAAGTSGAQDYVKAACWYRSAAEAGNAQGMVDLGNMYFLGTGVPKDEKVAASWFKRAADLGNSSAMFNLAGLYENGRGVPKNLTKALDLYRESAAAGNDEAGRRLAQLAGQFGEFVDEVFFLSSAANGRRQRGGAP